MAVITAPAWSIHYDEANDVLYASLGEPKPAVTDEVKDDIGLRYCPPNPQVIGITIMNFRRHFPHGGAMNIIQRLYRQYPTVPWPADA
jgi:uncharacterized protein YuzE